MPQKKSILKAYKRKWRRLSRKDQIFIIKFLGTSFLVLIITLLLISMLIFQGTNPHNQKKNDNTVTKRASSDTNNPKQETTSSSSEDNNEDLELLARLVNAEAGDYSRETQIAVASVVLNRVESDNYPDSIHDVIYQAGQYSPIQSGAIDESPNKQSTESARYVYEHGSQIPPNVVYQSSFVQGSGVWAELDGEYFCYE